MHSKATMPPPRPNAAVENPMEAVMKAATAKMKSVFMRKPLLDRLYSTMVSKLEQRRGSALCDPRDTVHMTFFGFDTRHG
jgi:hypothetical protein